MNNSLATRAADNIRILAAAMVERAKSGHPGGAMGGADFIQVLYSEFMSFDPDNMKWPFRDRFFLDPGHMSPMLYGVLSLIGKYSMNDLKNFRQWGSITPGHPERDLLRGVENTSGPLGQGHTMAVGAAITERFLAARLGEWSAHKIFAFISDGGVQEEISQGAGRIAGYLGLHNLIMFYDSNGIQLSTDTEAVTIEDTASKYRAWGWRVLEIEGNNPSQVYDALSTATKETEKPILIIGHTTMGKGCLTEDGSSFEGKSSTHGQPIGKAGASFDRTIDNLGGDPVDPFQIFPEVSAYYQDCLLRKKKMAMERYQEEEKWRANHGELAKKLDDWLKEVIPPLTLKEIKFKSGLASRAASGIILTELAEEIENMIVMSADLANSDKTDGFLKKQRPFTHHDFSGAFLHVGVSELTMAALANGMALHGGVIPACGTFFVFSDYMKPAVRLAALMELPVKYIWTHDAFRVGEDGPTHQPVEQEAQIRLLEKLKNHSGDPSMLVLRPADSSETVVSWIMALENHKTPTALLLSRQGIKDLPGMVEGNRMEEAEKARLGGYVVREVKGSPDVILVGNGSEVSTLVEGAELLQNQKGIRARVLSIPSEGLFRLQNNDYQNDILPDGIPVFGLTAGIPSTIEALVGQKGRVWGLDHFGYSAPASVLDEKFGFTPENVLKQVIDFLGTDVG